MASTSTQLQYVASLSPGSNFRIYDVFLSFRGEDTRNNFVDHLCSALHQVGIFMYKDDLKLERGESISPTLLKAIEDSRFAVVVFSKDYTSSKWCLEELVKILECQNTKALTILPVFYKVNPSDLRKQRGSVGEAFSKHERDSNEEVKQKVQIWRNALMEAASISGWDSEKDGPEAKLVRNIAIHILHRLGDNGSSVPKDVFGLPPRIEKVMSLLEMGLGLDDPRIVGICGMGGIGKTTIAQAVYHQVRSRFHVGCYLPNVKGTAEKHGLESLQRSLLLDIFSVSDNDIKIRSLDQGRSMIMNRVRCMRVLVVLDDVDHSEQLDALVGTLDWFGPGSRIIITTRDSHLLAKYEKSSVYNVEGLNDEEAFKLFCCKAFRKNQPTQGYEGLTNSVVRYAGGVPLALRVLGSFLFGRSIIEWRSAVDKLSEQPNADIQGVLKLSYDGLDHEEKEIFLDIACFFKQTSKDYAIDVLNACGFHADIGIRVLEDKALVTITHNQIGLHDLIQEMGRHIVNEEFPKEPGKRSRLWKYKDIYDTLTKKTNIAHPSHCTIGFPGREIPKYFRYQNNMGHYIRFQLMPDWCQRLGGLIVCGVFEAKAPIDAEVYVEFYGICNDVVDYAQMFWKSNVHFGSDHFFFIYERIDRLIHRMKTWTGMMFYFRSSRPEMFVPVKCGVEMMIDEEGQLIGCKRKRSCYDSDYNETDIRQQSNSKGLKGAVIQLNDYSQFELSEIQNIQNSVNLRFYSSVTDPLWAYDVYNYV